MRLDKALSLVGYSRSQAKEMIAKGRVRLGETVLRTAGQDVEIHNLYLDGAHLEIRQELYIMINKPAGVITATEDRSLPTVVSLLPENLQKRKIGPVGRLDRDVTGLVILTTDGQLAHRLISPKWKAEKVYRAECAGKLTQSDIDAFRSGIDLEEFVTLPAGMTILSSGEEQSVADVTLTEGKYHQVKRMFEAIGHPLNRLKRLRIGCVELDPALEEGSYRDLTEEEVAGLRKLSGLWEE